MSNNIGYFKEEGERIQKEFKNMYTALGDTIAREFKVLTPKLEASWVGVDQQNYTLELANRLQALYANAGVLIERANSLIAGAVNGWVDFQNGNTMQGGQVAVTDTEYIPTIGMEDAIHEVVQYHPQVPLSEKARTVEGPEMLASALNTFVETVKTEINGLASTMETKSKEVLRGQLQESAMSEYVTAIKNGIITVVTAIDDMKQAIYTLAGTNYESAAQDVSTVVNTESSDVTQSVNSIAGKWTMS